MRVFLVPTGVDAYQLYVEVPRETSAGLAGPPKGWFARQVQRFNETLAEAEQERLRGPGADSGPRTYYQRIMGKIAEFVAEQRLLWHLRKQTAVSLDYPDDITEAQAIEKNRAELSRDLSKHVRWLIIDGIIVLITGPLFFFVPGPNVVSWYFTFRAAGHFLAWRGSRNGLWGVTWTATPNAMLTSLRQALTLPAEERCKALDQISRTLELQHLTAFVERVASRGK